MYARHPRYCTSKISPQSQIVNREFYCKVLRPLREEIRRKRLDLWSTKDWLLNDDNEACHRALPTHEFLATTKKRFIASALFARFSTCVLRSLSQDEKEAKKVTI